MQAGPQQQQVPRRTLDQKSREYGGDSSRIRKKKRKKKRQMRAMKTRGPEGQSHKKPGSRTAAGGRQAGSRSGQAGQERV